MGILTGGNMTDQPTHYQTGTVMNGHVWTGTEWVPIKAPPKAAVPRSPWRMVAGVACLIGGVFAAIQALSWMVGFSELESEGNQFSGLLALLGLGAFAVSLAFLAAGITLVTKK